MARMIPPEPPGRGSGARAEGDLFHAFREGLSDDYTVFYRLLYLGGGRRAVFFVQPEGKVWHDVSGGYA